MCTHSQTNYGSLPASTEREGVGLGRSKRMMVYRSAFGMVCPPLDALVIAQYLLYLHTYSTACMLTLSSSFVSNFSEIIYTKADISSVKDWRSPNILDVFTAILMHFLLYFQVLHREYILPEGQCHHWAIFSQCQVYHLQGKLKFCCLNAYLVLSWDNEIM